MYSVKIASTNQQLNSILKLRYEVLRKPWSQTIDSASDQLEHKSINAFIQNNKGVYIACGRLQENEKQLLEELYSKRNVFDQDLYTLQSKGIENLTNEEKSKLQQITDAKKAYNEEINKLETKNLNTEELASLAQLK